MRVAEDAKNDSYEDDDTGNASDGVAEQVSGSIASTSRCHTPTRTLIKQKPIKTIPKISSMATPLMWIGWSVEQCMCMSFRNPMGLS